MHNSTINPLSIIFFIVFIASLVLGTIHKNRRNIGYEKKNKTSKIIMMVTAASLFLSVLFGNQDVLHKIIAGIVIAALYYAGNKKINERR